MGDTLSIQEAATQAASTLQEEATATEAEEVVKSEVDDVDETAGEETQEPEQPKADEEDNKSDDDDADFEHIDPESLPPKLKSVYKNLLKGFTQGRQRDSDRARQLEKELAEIKSKFTEPKPAEMPKFNTPEEYYAYIAETKAKETIKNERVEGYREEALREYPKLDPRLDEREDNPQYDPNFDRYVGSSLDAALGAYVQEHGTEVGFDYKSEFAKVKDQWDGYVDGLVKKYLKQQNENIKKSEQKLKKSTPRTSPGKVASTKPKTIREAIDAAREQQL